MSRSDRRSSSSGSRPRTSSSSPRRATRRPSRPASPKASSLNSSRPPRPLRAAGTSRETKRVGHLSVAGLGLTDQSKSQRALPRPLLWALVALVAVGVIIGGLFALSLTPILPVQQINAEATNHLTQENILKLAAVPDNATLLNVDTAKIEENLAKNPWVKSVHVSRKLPGELTISVEERQVFAIVTIPSGNSAWYLSEDGAWIEPMPAQALDGGDLVQVALAQAKEDGCLLIRDTPSTVDPKAGAKTTDAPILDCIQYQTTFSQGLASQIVSYSAASEEAISCVLSSGLEISLGAPNQISSKEAVINELMGAHPNQLTYINVRNPAKPSYRQISSSSVGAGTGVVASNDGAAAQGQEAAASGQPAQGQEASGSQSGSEGAQGSEGAGSSQGNGSSESTGGSDSQNPQDQTTS